MDQQTTRPNGPAAAAVLAAGIGTFVLGVMVVVAEAAKDNSFLDFSKNYGIGSGVGPLSGKVTIAVLAYVVSLVVAGLVLRGREVNFRRFFLASMGLIALGFALTFPPIFDLFAPK